MTGHQTREPLSDIEIDTIVALRRVAEPRGAVAELDGRYFYHGRPIVPWLEAPLAALVTAGLVALADPDPNACGLRRATLTPAGHNRHQELCQKHCLSPPT